MKFLLSFIILLAVANPASAAIFKCVSHSGSQTYSDIPCQNGAREIRIDNKKIPWIKTLEKRKPSHTKIVDTYKDNGDTIIRYRFAADPEMNIFMRTARQVSGQYVTLLNTKPPKDGMYGEALIKVSKKNTPAEKSPTKTTKP